MDLAAYDTAELRADIGEMLSVPGRVASGIRWLVTIELASIALAVALTWGGGLPWWGVLGFALYGGVVGVLLGVVGAVLFLAREELQRAEDVLRAMLELCIRAVHDMDGVVRGEQAAPEPHEVLDAVWEQVFSPIITTVLTAQFRFVGAPVAWVMRRALGAVVAQASAALDAWTPDQEEEVVRVAAETSAGASRIVGAFTWGAKSVRTLAGALKGVLLPLWLLFGVLITLAAGPIGVVLWVVRG